MQFFENVLRKRAGHAHWHGRLPDPVRWLDIGCRNPLSAFLCKRYHLFADQTEGDLEDIQLVGSYDLITCLEVIEHLFNPLHLLSQMKNALNENGVVILTTPCSPIAVNPNHFHEMDRSRLFALLDHAGLDVVEYRRVWRKTAWGLVSGFRPLLKLMLGCQFTSVCVLRSRKRN
jgi:SAM-dependent methyltransferase